jgi:hypothetical protein
MASVKMQPTPTRPTPTQLAPTRQAEEFPTEWALCYGDEPASGTAIPPSEDVRPEGQLAVLSVERIGCGAIRQ